MVRSIQDLVDDISPDALRIKLIDVQLELSSVKQSVIIPTINKFPFGLYFLSYGEICMIHRTFVFKDDYTPFLLPLCFSYIANTHIIITTPSFYQKYPPDLIEIYKKYGYGVYIIEINSLTLVEEP